MRAWVVWIASTTWLLAHGGPSARAEEFSYVPAGDLESDAEGRDDPQVYVPGMRFPLEGAPAYANSQVYGVGGMHGPAGDQCDGRNYAMPWYDNYCEPRSWDMPMCPSGAGHQGQDIRPATCEDRVHPAVAAEAGTITAVGSYSVALMTASGTRHRYLHMDPPTLFVEAGDEVTWGAPLGYVSDAFGDASTTIHLHYDIQQNVQGLGLVYVPTYMSLVRSYEALIGAAGATCDPVPPDGATLGDASPCFRQHGPPEFWRFVDDAGYGGTLRWTRGFVSDTPSNWAEWRLSLDEAGDYAVWIHNVPEYGSSHAAPWAVFAGGVRHDLAVHLAGREGWLLLGTFPFDAGEGQSVAVFDHSGEDTALDRRIAADAIRLVPDPPATDAGPADAGHDAAPAGDHGGGCTAAGARPAVPSWSLAPWLGLLLLGMLAHGRRTH